MTELLKYRLAARCEAAGRPNNEDNYHIIGDINKGDAFTGDVVLNLSDKGSLLVVCDGMGGMNAGEVASAIAVNTIKQWFETSRISEEVLATDATRCEYVKKAIQEADANIKNEGARDESKRGMGSTVVMAWLLDNKVYIGWCGDSRAYKYNPETGLMQMSHDHSYVQELVDAGKLDPELAFDHPNGNIITRSLGDPRGAAQPDVKVFNLVENDIIMLCSDGLCGVLRNNKIEDVVRNNTNSMNGCRDALWEAARNAGWHDNVTIVLAQIMPKDAKNPEAKQEHKAEESSKDKGRTKGKKNLILLIIACAVIAAVFFLIRYCGRDSVNTPEDNVSTCNNTNLQQLVDNFINDNFKPQQDDNHVYDAILDKVDVIKNCKDLQNKVYQAIGKHLNVIDGLSDENEKYNLKTKYERLKNDLQ